MFDSGPGATLSDRLRGALAQRSHGPSPVRPESVTALADLSSLGGGWVSTSAGPGYIIDSWYGAGHVHGNIPLRAALEMDVRRLAGQVREPRLTACGPGGFLFIDTETTGLGGAGAMVFLAGAARFEGSSLRLRQFLLPNPSGEPALIESLTEELDAAEALVSFNGKSFDLPALESRAILARRRPAWREKPHLDLLHPNRRLFRGSMSSHRLVVLESRLLSFERDDDCSSAEVPMRYFQFQRTGDPTWIRPVLRHNAWDILSLVALAAHLAALCDGRHGSLQAGRAAEYEGDWAGAARHFGEAASASPGRRERYEASERAARAHSRLGDYGRAASYWQAIVADGRHRRLAPFVELAKLCEHRLHDIHEAKRLVERALDQVEQGRCPPGPAGSETSVQALQHRLARLSRRADTGQPRGLAS